MLSITNSSMLKISVSVNFLDTTNTDRSTSCVDLHLELNSEGRLGTKRYDKRDDLNFPIVNFQFICSNIPAAITNSSMLKISVSVNFLAESE
jgi:hypothetical protein